MFYYIDTLWSYWNILLIQNFLELGKIRVSKVYRKLRSPVNRSRIRPMVIKKITLINIRLSFFAELSDWCLLLGFRGQYIHDLLAKLIVCLHLNICMKYCMACVCTASLYDQQIAVYKLECCNRDFIPYIISIIILYIIQLRCYL